MATLRDAVYGAAIGDALGVPFEFQGRDSFTCTGVASGGAHDQPAGTFSDDTSMLLATCDSIRQLDGRIDCDDMRRRFNSWAMRGTYAVEGIVFDIGITVSTALKSGHGMDGVHSNGNGALMRIAPLAFCDATDEQIGAVSAITHAHAISREACVAFVKALRELAAGMPIAQAVAGITVPAADYAFEPEKPIDQVESGGYVIHTLDAALWCLANTASFEECVLAAVNLGSDTDTTACVAGAAAGCAYGMDAIPADWMAALRGKEIIEGCLF